MCLLNHLKAQSPCKDPFYTSRLKFKLFLDLKIWALPKISYTRQILTGIFVNIQ